ncbi:Unknown protein [Striga hermonthica]|uniref:Retrotransposon Copia-like N-terminal domain-containing protein n=1 Tax=Striga hermonthica TaxID=68872 RepID=A0A9N7RP20_STRHE|nr:Unknown protein [Striga hermonthica]
MPQTKVILTGEKYSTWDKAVRRALEAKNKAGFVDGSIHKSAVIKYFTKLKGIWDVFANYKDVVVCTYVGCTCGVTTRLAAKRKTEMMHRFLMGLNAESYGVVRS